MDPNPEPPPQEILQEQIQDGDDLTTMVLGPDYYLKLVHGGRNMH